MKSLSLHHSATPPLQSLHSICPVRCQPGGPTLIRTLISALVRWIGRGRDAHANWNIFPLMLLAYSVDTPIHINRSYLLASRVLCGFCLDILAASLSSLFDPLL